MAVIHNIDIDIIYFTLEILERSYGIVGKPLVLYCTIHVTLLLYITVLWEPTSGNSQLQLVNTVSRARV